jgi:hypothetical protein
MHALTLELEIDFNTGWIARGSLANYRLMQPWQGGKGRTNFPSMLLKEVSFSTSCKKNIQPMPFHGYLTLFI